MNKYDVERLINESFDDLHSTDETVLLVANQMKAHMLAKLNEHTDPMIKVCRECKQPFELSHAQAKWFHKRKLAIPERCPACRAKRKEEQLNG